MAKMILSGKGRRWALTGHPWVYADDVAEGKAQPGELISVAGPNNDHLGWALFSTSSRIALRFVTRAEEQPNREFWLGLVQRAIKVRADAGFLDPEGACRLLSGDADGLPGFVADRYGTVLVLQCGTQGADRMRDFLIELVREALPFPLTAVVDRSDTSVRRFENLESNVETLDGTVDEAVLVRDGDLQYEVDIFQGHKTGHYLDQATNRIRAARGAEGKRVLDAFSYDGLFGIRAALAGAESVLCLEQNEASGQRLLRNAELNGVADRVTVEKTNCMKALRAKAEEGDRYGLVIIDPPAFARNRREIEGAERGYVELNRRGVALCEPGGRLVTASCSYNVRPEDFADFLTKAINLSGREAWLEELTGSSLDHPHRITLPETQYLKCAFLRVG
ncbi:MAG: class I SAM-dependent rRNA methyltransferase [Planctomycetota bacterium]|nr:class I SAM-dependent rRNA methyltransferase [Planctomycetota bacterium]